MEHYHYPEYDEDYKFEALITNYCFKITRQRIKSEETLLSAEDNVLTLLGADKQKMEIIAEKCRDKFEDFEGITQDMAS